MMKPETMNYLNDLVRRYPTLKSIKKDVLDSFNLLKDCFKNNGKLLIAGNGGSSADAEHISGELMKGFLLKRKISKEFEEKLVSVSADSGKDIASKLQQGFPVINLASHQSLNTAFLNDVKEGGEMLFAQQVNVYGRKDDVFLAISTSGNSKNILNASIVAKALGMKIVGLTGEDGGKLKSYCDVCIKAPAKLTHHIQEYHLPIYHCLCLMLEEEFFE